MQLKKLALLASAPAALVATLVGVVIIATATSDLDAQTNATFASSGGVAGSQCGSGNPVNVTVGAVSGYQMTTERRQNAATIIGMGLRLGVTRPGLIYGIAIALRESQLHNYLVPLDHDSYGVFQQRTMYWGPVSQLTQVDQAAKLFFKRMLKDVPDYANASVSLDDVVATVQAPDLSTLPQYDDWLKIATEIVDGAKAGSAATSPNLCGAPQVSSTKIQTVLNAAYEALARRWPYVWDAGTAKGPSKGLAGCDAVAIHGCATVGFDCSGLTLYLYAQIGITLGHQTNDQFNDPQGRPVSLGNLRPGDLVFFGTASNVHHVGIFVKKIGTSYQMIDTPTEGQTVMTHYFYGPKDQEGDYAGARRFAA